MLSQRSRDNSGRNKQAQDRMEKQELQVSTNGQRHSAVAELGEAVLYAEIFTRLTEREARSLQISRSREEERAGPLSHLFTYQGNTVRTHSTT